MTKRNYFYKITEEGGVWTAKRDGHIMFQERVKHLKQFRTAALMTTKENGKHDLYLPTNSEGIILLEQKCIPFLTDIESYQYINGTFLLRMEDYVTFVNSYSYSKGVSFGNFAEERRKKLIKIFCQNAYSMEEFYYLKPYRYQEGIIICKADGEDYVIKDCYFFGRKNHELIKIYQLGEIEPLPGNNGCFKIITSNGEYIYEGFAVDITIPQTYNSIIPFSIEDYSSIFPKEEGYNGYWFKNLDSKIVRISIYPSNKTLYNYRIDLKEPAQEVRFINQYVLKSEPCYNKELKLDVWELTYENNEKKLLLNYIHPESNLPIPTSVIIDKKDLM